MSSKTDKKKILSVITTTALMLANMSGAETITQNFEVETLGNTTPPTGWSLIIVDADPQTAYVTTNGLNGSGLGGQITANHASNGSSIPGAYLVNSGSPFFFTTKPISGSFNFYIPDAGNYASCIFMFGNIKTGITETNSGQYLGIKLMKNTFAARGGLVTGNGSSLATDTTQSLAANTWYSLTFSWTPTNGTSGIFSYRANNITSTNTSPFTFDSEIAYFGFGSGGYYTVDMSGRFDNINIIGSARPKGTVIFFK